MRFAREKTIIKWFRPEPDNVEDLKSMYRKLALEHHPDRGGDKITMQEINGEYAALFESLKDIHKSTRPDGPRTYEAQEKTTETPEDFIRIVNELFKLDGLEVELCGRWLWIGGETKKHKDELKALGCKWSKNKEKWSWHYPEDSIKTFKGKKAWSMDAIRSAFGSERLGRDENDDDRRGGYAALAG